MGFIVRVLLTGVAIWATSWLIPDHFAIVGSTTTGGKVVIVLAVALIYSVVNAIVRPIVKFVSIPLYVLTLGLFTLVVNALMLMLTAWITEHTDWGIRLSGGFWWAVGAALIISVLNVILSAIVGYEKKHRKSR